MASSRSSSSTPGGSWPLQFVVHPLPGSAEQLADRLREVGDRLRLPDAARPGPLVPSMSGFSASQIEVGPSHFAFLLSDGRLCRLPFSVISDRLDLNKSNMAVAGGSTNSIIGSLGGSGGAGGGGGGKGGGCKSTHSTTSTGTKNTQFWIFNFLNYYYSSK
jgi:E3 ubiquitin-protein ligase EDD1